MKIHPGAYVFLGMTILGIITIGNNVHLQAKDGQSRAGYIAFGALLTLAPITVVIMEAQKDVEDE